MSLTWYHKGTTIISEVIPLKKKYRNHIKVYPRTEEEEKLIREVANAKGFSASAWLLSLALKEIKKEEK